MDFAGVLIVLKRLICGFWGRAGGAKNHVLLAAEVVEPF